MSDYNSSLPVRTQTTGDLIAELAGAGGTTITSTTISLKEALDVNVANSITASNPSVGTNSAAAPSSSTQAGGLVSSSAPSYTAGNLDPLSLTTSGLLRVDGSGATQPVSGTITANQGTAAALAGAWPVEITDGTNILGTSAHPVRIDPTGTTTQPVSGTVAVSNLPSTADTNYGTVGASTLRSAAQIGNATGAANFNAGATGAQTLRVEANQGAANATPWNQNISQISGASPSATNALPAQIATAGAFVSASNPLSVTIESTVLGTAVNDYKDASAIGAGSSDNHDYTVTAGKTLTLKQIVAAGSGKAKMEVEIETGVATGVFTSKFVQFNSTADTNMQITLQAPISVAAGVRVRVVMSNRDLLSQDLYSTICGSEA